MLYLTMIRFMGGWNVTCGTLKQKALRISVDRTIWRYLLITSQFTCNINVHTDNYVIYLYLDKNCTKIKQICKLTDMNTVCIKYVKWN